MTTDKSIFGLRFQSNEEGLPSREDLKRFCRFELKLADISTEAKHEDLLLEKRKEMLGYLLGVLEKGPA